MANESTIWLYEQLTGKGYNVGKNIDEFDNLMRTNAESRQWAYDTATKSGLNVGKDIDEFSSLVGGMDAPSNQAAMAPYAGTSVRLKSPEALALRGLRATAPSDGAEARAGGAEAPAQNHDAGADAVQDYTAGGADAGADAVQGDDMQGVALDADSATEDAFTGNAQTRMQAAVDAFGRGKGGAFDGVAVTPSGYAESFGRRGKAVVERLQRQHDFDTDESRRTQWVANARARVMGVPSRPAGMPAPSPQGGIKVEAEPEYRSPRVRRVWRDASGEVRSEWEMPDGSTGDYMDAAYSEYAARQARLNRNDNRALEAFRERMRQRGLDPDNDEDVYQQQLYERWQREMSHIDRDIEAARADVEAARKEYRDAAGREGATIGDMLPGRAVWKERMEALKHKSLAEQRLRQLEEARERRQRGERNITSGVLEDIGAGIVDGSRGMVRRLEALADPWTLLSIKEKQERGEALTAGERGVLESYFTKSGSDLYSGDEGGVYQVARFIPEALEMAAEFGLAPGAGLTRRATAEVFEQGFRRGMKRLLTDPKALNRAIDAAVVEGAAIASTTQLDKNMAEAVGRTMQMPVFDDRGRIVGFSGDSLGEAMLKTGFRAVSSNAVFLPQTRLGEGIMRFADGTAIGKGINDIFRGAARYLPVGNPIEGFAKMKSSELVSVAMGDETFGQWADPQNNAVLIGSLLASEFAMGVPGKAVQGHRRYDLGRSRGRVRKAYEAASEVFGEREGGEDVLRVLGDAIVGATDEEVVRMLSFMMANSRPDEASPSRTLGKDGRFTRRECSAVLDIVRAVYDYRGREARYNALYHPERLETATKEESGDVEDVEPVQRLIGTADDIDGRERAENAFADGYAATDGAARSEAVRDVELTRYHLVKLAGKEVAEAVERNPLEALDRLGDDEQVNRAVIDFVNALSASEGAMQRAADDVEGRISDARAELMKEVYRPTGEVWRAKLRTGQEVSIVSGEPDGGARGVVVVLVDGSLKMVPATDIAERSEPVSVDALMTDVEARIRTEAADELEHDMTPARTFNYGPGKITVRDADGEIVRGVVLEAENGRVVIYTERPVAGNENAAEMSEDELDAILESFVPDGMEETADSGASTAAPTDGAEARAGGAEAPAQNHDAGAAADGAEAPVREQISGKNTPQARLSRQEAEGIIAEMERRAEVAPELELTIENWDAEFGEDGIVNTPIGEVKMGENQFTKLSRQGRNGKLGMVKPTLEKPDIIIEDSSEAKDPSETERKSSYVFVKTYLKPDGSRYYYFTSVTVSKENHEVVISNQEKRKSVLTNLLLKGKLVWKHADNVSDASDVADGLYSSQGKTSDPATEGTDAPQTNDVLSADKDNTFSADNQKNNKEQSDIVDESENKQEGGSESSAQNQTANDTAADGAEAPVREQISGNNTPQARLSRQEAEGIIAEMEMSAVNDPGISLSAESWQQSFGLNNSIVTPLGKVKMGEGQYQKLVDKKRSTEFGMVVQTLQDPDVVFIEPSEAKEGQTTEREFSYVFVKTFIRDGKKLKYYTSVSVLKDGMEVSISSHIASKTAITKKLQDMERAYTKQSLLPNSSEWHLAEHPTDVPDLLPTQGKSDADKEVYDVPALGSGKDTDTTGVNSGHENGATAPAGNSPKTSADKDNTFSADNQKNNKEQSDFVDESANKQEGGAESSAQATALARVPMDDSGKRQWTAVPADTAWDALVEVSGGEAGAEMIAAAQIEQAQKALDALSKKAPTYKQPKLQGDPVEMAAALEGARKAYEAALADYESRKSDAGAQLDAWKAIAAMGEERTREAKAAAEAEAAVPTDRAEAPAQDRTANDTAAADRDEAPVRGAGTSDDSRGETIIQDNSSEKKEITHYDPRTMPDEEKARRGDLLRNATAIEVKPGLIVATKDMTARKAAEKWWDENIGEPVVFDTEAGEVEIDKTSIKDSLSHGYRQEKLDAVTSLAEGFRHAVYLGSMGDFNRPGVTSHYFAYPINYESRRRYVFCRAMADNNKNRLYVHEVFMAEGIKESDTLQTIASASKDGELHGGIALYKAILKNVLEVSEDKGNALSEEKQGLDDESVFYRADKSAGLEQIGDEETDENGLPFVVSENGSTSFGVIREESGLPGAPIKLSEGYQDENGKGYGLRHIEAGHGEEIRNAGFSTIEEFVSYVAKNYDEDNIRVGRQRRNGSTTYLIQVTDSHDNTLFIELSRDGSYWNVNSGGVFRKGYSDKKETVAKTEPQQPNNAVSSDSSLSTDEQSGTSSIEPNGESTVSDGKVNDFASDKQGLDDESVFYRADKSAGLEQIGDREAHEGVADYGNTGAVVRERADFDASRERAVAEHGIVMPGLNEAVVRVVQVPRHDFAGTGKQALQAAEAWAKDNLVGIHTATDSEGGSFEYSISNDAVEKYVSRSATAKSDNIGVHLAALKKLPEIIAESIEAEVHADYKKQDGVRGAQSEINPQSLVHRFYGAVDLEGKIYRVKTTMREYEDKNRLPLAHSYEITEIELLEAPSDGVANNSGEPLAMTSNSSISAAKLLKGVEKSYDKGKYLLDESKYSDAHSDVDARSARIAGRAEEPRRRMGKTLPGRSLFDLEPEQEAGATKVATQEQIDEMGRERADFDASRERAVAEHGIVMPGLNEAVVRVVQVPRHDFAGTGKQAIEKARAWAENNLIGQYVYHEGKSDEFAYTIDDDAVDKYLSSSSTKGSDNLGIHLAALKKLPAIIEDSIEVEIHADYAKNSGRRTSENGINSSDILIHRFYGAVAIDGIYYRVKTTIKERRNGSVLPYNYQVTELELLISGSEASDALSNSNPISAAKLLKGVEKSYDKGKYLLDESKYSDAHSDVDARSARITELKAQADAFAENYNSRAVTVVVSVYDIENEELSDAVKRELTRKFESGTPACYCMENKKIYIFASAGKSEMGMDYILFHENVHAVIDAMPEYPAEKLSALAEAIVSANPKLADSYSRTVEEYGKLYADEEFVAYTLSSVVVNPAWTKRLLRRTENNINSFAHEIINQITAVAGRDKRGNSEEFYRTVQPGASRGRGTSDGDGEFAAGGAVVAGASAEGRGLSGTDARTAGVTVGEMAARAQALRELTPLRILPHSLSKEELRAVYSELPPVKKDGREIRFYNSAFKKVYKDGGLFEKIVPQLDDVLGSSILAYSEGDKLGGTVRPDGSVHKEHRNVEAFDNYIGKVEINGQDYYVRFTVQNNKGGEAGTHSFFVSSVELYKENAAESRTIPITSRGTTNFSGIVDAKLQQFFELASSGDASAPLLRVETAARTVGVTVGEMADHVAELASKLHLDNVEVVTDASVLKGEQAKAKGFFNPRTGKITIVVPNHADLADVEATVVHEGVVHRGLRNLVGEARMDEFLDGIYESAEGSIRSAIRERAEANGWDFRRATEEYMADLGERIGREGFERMDREELTFWGKVKATVQRLLDRFIKGLGWSRKVVLGDKELGYILWRSWKKAEAGGMDFVDMAQDAVMRHAMNEEASPSASEQSHLQANDRFNILNKEVDNVIIDKNKAPQSREAALAALTSLTQPFRNHDQNVDIYVSKSNARHSMSFRSEAQIKALGQIDEIIAKAVKIGELAPTSDEADTTKCVHIYYCPVQIGGNQYSARLTVKEYFQGDKVLDQLNLYNYQLREMASNAQSASHSLLTHPSEAKVRYKVSELIHNTQDNDYLFFEVDKEKGKLIDSLNGLSNSETENEQSSSAYKGTTLESLLQTSLRKINARGEDDVLYRSGGLGLDNYVTAGAIKLSQIRGSADVAAYVSTLRLGGCAKVSFLVLDNQLRVVGNFHTDHITLDDSKALGHEMAAAAIQYGGRSVILSATSPWSAVTCSFLPTR